MTAEHEATRVALAKLQVKLDRIKLAGERIEQIYKRANRRKFQDVHSHEAQAICENARIIAFELHDGPRAADEIG